MAEFPATQFRKLSASVRSSYRSLEGFRRKRIDFLRQICGKHYGDGASTNIVPFNLIELADTIHRGHLVPREPRVLITTKFEPLRSFAADFELAANAQAQEQDIEGVIDLCVSDAILACGLAKLGPVKDEGGERLTLDTVDFEDYVHDDTARRDHELSYIGNKYWLDKATAVKMYKKRDQIDKMPEVDAMRPNQDGSEPASTLSSPDARAPYRPRVELWDAYLCHEKLIVTWAEGDSVPLAVTPWEGPNHRLGPYHRLAFRAVQHNVMPLPPAAKWYDIHMLANTLFRKLGRQAQRQKTMLAYSGTDGAKTANRINQTNDGEGVHAQGKIEERKTGGIDGQNLAFFLQVRQLASYIFGGLDTIGGLGPQAGTLGQEQQLLATASVPLAQMSDNVFDFAEGLFRAMAWYEWHGPGPIRTLFKPMYGVGGSRGVNVDWNSKNRKGKFSEYDIDVDVFSLQNTTPEGKLATLMSILDRMVAPYLALMQSQGKGLDFAELLNQAGRLGNLTDELGRVIVSTPPQSEGTDGGKSSPVTTRKTIRQGRPGATRATQENQLMAAAMASANGSAE